MRRPQSLFSVRRSRSGWATPPSRPGSTIEPGAIQAFLESLPEGTPVALETVGNWYWIADEIEAAGCLPLLTHAAKAKVMMGNVNKTDKLDAKGLAKLLHLDSLPTVWLPPGEIRDERELHRTRMALSKLRTALKNRIHATLAKYGITSTEHSDIFVGTGRAWLQATLSRLPPETGRCVAQETRSPRRAAAPDRSARRAHPRANRADPLHPAAQDASPASETSWPSSSIARSAPSIASTRQANSQAMPASSPPSTPPAARPASATCASLPTST